MRTYIQKCTYAFLHMNKYAYKHILTYTCTHTYTNACVHHAHMMYTSNICCFCDGSTCEDPGSIQMQRAALFVKV